MRNIDVIRAIRPENAGSGEPVLEYQELPEAIKRYAVDARERAQLAWSSEPDSLEERKAVRQLASHYLVLGAEKAVQASHEDTRNLWAGRFTVAAAELYGAPDVMVAQQLLNDQYDYFLSYSRSPNVSRDKLQLLLDFYDPLVDESVTPEIDQFARTEAEVLAAYGQVIMNRFAPLFDLAQDDNYPPPELANLFDRALTWLVEYEDASWADWKTELQDGTSVMVMQKTKVIRIGRQRSPTNSAGARKLLAHELIRHARAANNGYKYSDIRMAHGVAGFVEPDEGLAILTAAALEGSPSDIIKDRYIDIALAMGLLGDHQVSRSELFKLAHARAVIRQELDSESNATEADLVNSAHGYVDRIYRGGRGDDTTAVQAVFTKDLVYYQGYRRMLKYAADCLEHGQTAAEIFDYVSQGMFDPTDPQHIALVESLTS